MPKNDFSKVDFKSANVNFKDKRKLLSSNIKGSFTRDAIVNNLQLLSDNLKKHDKNASLGVAMHYKNANDWVPSLFTDAGQAVRVWDISDSDKGKMYEGDTIDSCEFYIIKENVDVKYLKPSKFNGKLLLPERRNPVREVSKKIFD